jgi:hypothetical protein
MLVEIIMHDEGRQAVKYSFYRDLTAVRHASTAIGPIQKCGPNPGSAHS